MTITKWMFAAALVVATACGKGGDKAEPAAASGAGSAATTAPTTATGSGSAATTAPTTATGSGSGSAVAAAAGSGSAAPAAGSAAVGSAADLPTSADFEAAAKTKIDAKNVSAQLDDLEKQLGK